MRREGTARVRVARGAERGPAGRHRVADHRLRAGAGLVPSGRRDRARPAATARRARARDGRRQATSRLAPVRPDVHIVMPGWLPPVRSEAQPLSWPRISCSAYLYAEYRGNQDDRWAGYVSGPVLSALESIWPGRT